VTATLELAAVTRRFGEVIALDGLDLEVASGEVVALLGHNGAGKTTTVRLLAGLLAPDEGTVRVQGRDPVVDGDQVRQRLGVLPARPVVDDRLTGRQNLAFVTAVFGLDPGRAEARSAELLERFGLTSRADERVGTYSTGMRQRLSLARVLLTEPEVLLLDEPTAALDPVAARLVRRTLGELAAAEERTVVLCTHDLAEAEALCDRVVVLANGAPIATGTPQELARAHGVAAYHLDVGEAAVGRATRLVRDHLPELTVAGHPSSSDVLVLRGLSPELAPELVRLLVTAELDVRELHRVTPSLEEVYLALHGEVPDEEERS
jgi:ABC-type multidrug transport system ATPase subunit